MYLWNMILITLADDLNIIYSRETGGMKMNCLLNYRETIEFLSPKQNLNKKL